MQAQVEGACGIWSVATSSECLKSGLHPKPQNLGTMGSWECAEQRSRVIGTPSALNCSLDSESLGSSDITEPLPISMHLHAQLYLQIQEVKNDWNRIARPMLKILPGSVVHDSGLSLPARLGQEDGPSLALTS